MPEATGPVSAGRSVYGLRVHGLDDVAELAPPTAADVDLIPVVVRQSRRRPPPDHELDSDRHSAPLLDGRFLDLQRGPGRATFYGPVLSPDLLAHPYLGPVAVAFGRWAGREAFHAGAFVADGRAWLVSGPSTAGKSTLMGALAAAGVPILADDVAVTDGSVVFAGPRSVDLREPYPDGGLPATAPVRRARCGTRWRIDLPAVPGRVPLGGWFFLHWDERSSMTPVPMSELLKRVAAIRSMRRLYSDPAGILSLASCPAWDLRRPRDWSGLRGTVDAMLAAAGGAAAAVSGPVPAGAGSSS